MILILWQYNIVFKEISDKDDLHVQSADAGRRTSGWLELSGKTFESIHELQRELQKTLTAPRSKPE